MKSKFLWIMFVILSLILVPVKIFSSLTVSGFDKSTEFFIISMVILVSFFAFILFSFKQKSEIYEINSNPYLGVSGLLVGGAFVWNSMSLITSQTSSDAFFQNLFSLIFAMVSGVTFVLIALSYFTGKNKFSRVPVLIFFPIFWFIIKMISFLSISDDTPDQYEVTMSSFILLFLMNQTKAFIRIPNNKNTVKRLVMFGFPAVATCLMFCIPEIFFKTQSAQNLDTVFLSSLLIQITLGIYICFTLVNIQSKRGLE